MITIGGRAHTMEELRQVLQMGLPFVEMSLDDPQVVTAQLKDLQDLKRDHGATFLAHYPNEDNPFDVDVLRARFLPKIKTLIDLSEPLGVTKATIHFWIDNRWAPPGLVPRKLELLSEIVAYAAGAGIVICIENLSERFDSFQAAFGSIEGLRMTLDIGHGQLLARENTSHRFIEHCYERIVHVHVHDNHGGTSVRDDEHLALGRGIVDYVSILRSLAGRGYSSTITMEVKPHDMTHTLEALRGCVCSPAS